MVEVDVDPEVVVDVDPLVFFVVDPAVVVDVDPVVVVDVDPAVVVDVDPVVVVDVDPVVVVFVGHSGSVILGSGHPFAQNDFGVIEVHLNVSNSVPESLQNCSIGEMLTQFAIKSPVFCTSNPTKFDAKIP